MVDSLTGIDRTKLRRWLTVFFFALAIPSGILIQHAYSQLKWQSFHQQRLLAEELATRIDIRIRRLIEKEESHSFSDYQFVVVDSESKANFLQRSPLSEFPVISAFPGSIGYFQVDTQGTFSTPLLPRQQTVSPPHGIPHDEFNQRLALQKRIREVLSQNRLVDNGEADRLQKEMDGTRRTNIKKDLYKSESAEVVLMDRADTLSEQAETLTGKKPIQNQAAFDQLNSKLRQKKLQNKGKQTSSLGRIADFKLDYSYQSGLADQAFPQKAKKKKKPEPKRAGRKERSAMVAPQSLSKTSALESDVSVQSDDRIHTFESEIDPFEFSLLDSGQFVLFRKVWREQQRFIQGALVEQQPFLNGIVNTTFEESSLSAMSTLMIAYQGTVFSAITGGASPTATSEIEEFSGSVLYQTRLAPPLNELELVFSITQLPLGPGVTLISWVAIVLTGVLFGGFYLMYRTGVVQIRMAQQQRNFVSAISHELKTPLTSIRMYSEILQEGWAPEEKKTTYYNYIQSESERLTRLINNVLQLARLERSELRMVIKPISIGSLMETVQENIAVQTERAGFTFNLLIPPEVKDVEIETDPDVFTQIIINLLDNALKFSLKSENKWVDLGCSVQTDRSIRFTVRDYGPGIAPNQMKKIFKLFYRSENELTRETVGTGIGLALVIQLAKRMKARVDVVNRSPGAEFRVTFPPATRTQTS